MPTRPCWVEIRTRSLEENYRFLGASPLVRRSCWPSSKQMHMATRLSFALRPWCALELLAGRDQRRRGCCGARALPGSADSGDRRRLCRARSCFGPAQAYAVAWELGQLDELESAARAAGVQGAGLPVHLEIDTGMSRQGASLESLGAVLARFRAGSPLKLEGVMTHLFAADELDRAVTGTQLDRLEQALTRITDTGLMPDWLNMGSSAALLTGEAAQIAALAGRHGMRAMLRPGLALYGLTPKQRYPAMAKILQFPAPTPEPPVPSMLMPRPVAPIRTNAVSIQSYPHQRCAPQRTVHHFWSASPRSAASRIN